MITFDRDICFVDVETLGLEREAPIWEFAAVRLRTDPSLPEFAPVSFQILHDEGSWLEGLPQQFADDYRARFDLQAALPPREAAREIVAITDGAVIAGSNPSFDMERLDLLMSRFDLTPEWHYHPLDIPSMAAGQVARSVVAASAELGDEVRLGLVWRSNDLSRRLGIDPDQFDRHTALGDVKWCLAQWHAMNGQVAE
jgi:DNA polymerase III epsilon subunit-like protein